MGGKDWKTWLYLTLWKEIVQTVGSVKYKNIIFIIFLRILYFFISIFCISR